jgi:hypothetical protein
LWQPLHHGLGSEAAAKGMNDIGNDGNNLIGIFLGNVERWRELNDGIEAIIGAADQPTALKLIGKPGHQVWFFERQFALAVVNQFEGHEQPAPTDIADIGMFAHGGT